MCDQHTSSRVLGSFYIKNPETIFYYKNGQEEHEGSVFEHASRIASGIQSFQGNAKWSAILKRRLVDCLEPESLSDILQAMSSLNASNEKPYFEYDGWSPSLGDHIILKAVVDAVI